ncbi:MAG: hypothetical protein RIS79_1281 [Verrucomicrobiota bacterium]
MISTLALAFPLVSSLEAGLRADCVRLIEFEAELTRVLEESQELANVRGSPADWDTGCQHHWDHVTAVLRRIHRILAEMHNAVGRSHPQTAWKWWEELQRQEARLAIALSGLRDQAAHLNEAAADDWRKLVVTIESHRKAVQAGIERLHIRLKSWASHSPRHQFTDAMAIAASGAAAPPPVVADIDEVRHLRDLGQAAIEIEEEQHQELGLPDAMKALFMWVENPEERVRKEHAKTT